MNRLWSYWQFAFDYEANVILFVSQPKLNRMNKKKLNSCPFHCLCFVVDLSSTEPNLMELYIPYKASINYSYQVMEKKIIWFEKKILQHVYALCI